LASPLIRVAIVDDHPVVGEGTAAVLRAEPDLEVVGVATSLDAARSAGLLDRAGVDVVLLDLRLGADSGLRLLAEPAGRADLPAVVVLTAYDYPQYVDAALQLGAAGFVLKTAPLAELLEAIRRVAAGGLAFSRSCGWSPTAGATTRSAWSSGSGPRPSRRISPGSSSARESAHAPSSRPAPFAKAGWTCRHRAASQTGRQGRSLIATSGGPVVD